MTDNTAELIERLNDHMERTVFREGKCGFTTVDLPFYKNAKMVVAKTFTTRPIVTRKFIVGDETVVAYLKFFFDSVAVPTGRLAMIETLEDLKLLDDASDELKSALTKLIAAPVITKDGNAYFVKTFVLYDTTLYHAEMTVTAKGEVEMTEQETAYENLPVEKKIILR